MENRKVYRRFGECQAFEGQNEAVCRWRDDPDRFYTDNTNQYLFYQKAGYFQHMPPLHADLGQILNPQRPARDNPQQKIYIANLGLVLEDIAVASLIYTQASKRDWV